jgi:hypothetical protein
MASQAEPLARPDTAVRTDSPPDQPQRMPSGRVLIRMPRSLHQRLLD